MLTYDLISGKSVTGTLHWATRRLSTSLPSYSPPSRLPHSDPNMLLPGPPLNRSLISGAPSDTSVPVAHSTVMFGDNESVVNTASMPFSKLNKRHNVVHHKTRSCIAANILRFIHTPGIFNPADILSKHWDAPSVWKILRPILFTEGDDDDIPPITAQGLRKAHHRC
jgi:hypothetical protein